jgi:hypothetical protein
VAKVAIIMDISEKFAVPFIVFRHFDSEKGGTASSQTLIISTASTPRGMQRTLSTPLRIVGVLAGISTWSLLSMKQ